MGRTINFKHAARVDPRATLRFVSPTSANEFAIGGAAAGGAARDANAATRACKLLGVGRGGVGCDGGGREYACVGDSFAYSYALDDSVFVSPVRVVPNANGFFIFW